MRFRFCGGLEPPDWLLAEIPLLSSLDETTATATCLSICSASDEPGDEFPSLSPQDSQATVAVLRFVLLQAAKYDISEREIAVELLQLGIRRDIADAIAAVFGAQRLQLRNRLQSESFKFPTIEQLKWRVHQAKTSDSEGSVTKRVEMRLQLDRQTIDCDPIPSTNQATSEAASKVDTVAITMTEDKFLALYEELTQAHAMLQSLKRV